MLKYYSESEICGRVKQTLHFQTAEGMHQNRRLILCKSCEMCISETKTKCLWEHFNSWIAAEVEVCQRCEGKTENEEEEEKNVLCNVPEIETIIKIFQIGWIPTGFSRRGLRIQMCLHTGFSFCIDTHKNKLFIFSLKEQHEGLGGNSLNQLILSEGLFLWSPTVRTLKWTHVSAAF